MSVSRATLPRGLLLAASLLPPQLSLDRASQSAGAGQVKGCTHLHFCWAEAVLPSLWGRPGVALVFGTLPVSWDP